MVDRKDPAALAAALKKKGYLPSPELASSVSTALTLKKPLLLEGEPGVGKTTLARALAGALDAQFFRLQCYEGISQAQALYDWDFRKQLLALRSVEVGQTSETALDIFSDDFLLRRPILDAFTTENSVLLIDEIDRSDAEFEAFLLEALGEGSISIPERTVPLKTFMPAVILTSNRTRELHYALKRRCLYHWIDHPTLEHEAEILMLCLQRDDVEWLAEEVARLMAALRGVVELDCTPGISAAEDLATALLASDQMTPTRAALDPLIGLLAKSHDDQDKIRQALDAHFGSIPKP